MRFQIEQTPNVSTQYPNLSLSYVAGAWFICYSPSQKTFPRDLTGMISDRRSAPARVRDKLFD